MTGGARSGLGFTSAVGLSACAVALTACSRAPAASPPLAADDAAPVRPLQLDPLVSVVSGAGLEWLADIRPREVLSDRATAAMLEPLFPESAAARFSARYGGVDPRDAEEVVLASYANSLFGAARVAVDPAAVEGAFGRRAEDVDGRALRDGTARDSVLRVWGTVDGAREQVAVFGHDAVAIEHGQLGPLRAAVFFAEGKLLRTRPANRAEPLAPVFARLSDPAPPPLAFYAPGPFTGPWAQGVGGLLRAATAVAVAAKSVPEAGNAGRPAVRVRVILEGAWGTDGPAAGQRLLATFRALATDPLGHLTGLDRPVEGPSLTTDEAAVELDITLDLAALATGVHDATAASLPEILGLSAAH